MIGVRLQPVDTWFFRDGTPFTMGSTPQDNVGSLFPPHPPTVAGALRAALALSNGWNGHGRWPADFCEVLGDGPENLGALYLDGPFLLRDRQPLFRLPRHLLGVSDGTHWRPSAFVCPGEKVACDLGDEVRLPEVVDAALDAGKTGGTRSAPSSTAFALKSGDGFWLTRKGLGAVLAGRLPDRGDLVPDQCLWSDEPRIGLERDGETRTAREGMLYSTRHVRPARGVSLGVRIAGLPAGWTPPFGSPLTLGGEGRLAECREWQECREWDAELALEAPLAEIGDTRRVALVALSPVDLPRDIRVGNQPLEALGNARVVSACLDRPQQVGGWNSLERRPLPLRPVLLPGSTLFCELGEPERFREVVSKRGGRARIGLRQQWGFGLVAPGVWPVSKEDHR